MWYRYNRRGRRGGWPFLWFLFIPLFFIGAGHGPLGFLLWLAVIVAFGFIARAIFMTVTRGSNPQNQWFQQNQYQSPYQQNQYYQPMNQAQQQYQPYQQGYQQPYYQPTPASENLEGQGSQQQKQQTVQQGPYDQYDQYDEPTAQYNQELPPMQQ